MVFTFAQYPPAQVNWKTGTVSRNYAGRRAATALARTIARWGVDMVNNGQYCTEFSLAGWVRSRTEVQQCLRKTKPGKNCICKPYWK